jgi:alternate signal-mediated exported protein
MNKTTKGALAAVAAGVLLLGGAGTLAFWTAGTDVTGGTLTSGELKLTGVTCDPDWVFDANEDEASHAYVNGDLIVPGDTLTKTCTGTVQATGEHLRATVEATGGAKSGALAPTLVVTPTATIGGNTVTEITEDNDGETVSISLEVEFPYGVEDNATQNLSATLTDYSIALTQVHD